MKKRILSLVVAMTILCAFVPILPASAATIDIGDYIQMGTYYGEPILWRCVDIDENGPLMLSDKILCIKAFDAEASANSTTDSHSRDDYRKNNESNYWGDSNMRSWLNSSASAGNVNWLCGNPPIKEELWGGYNAYDKEAGFLSNFTQSERNAMKEVRQKSLLSYPEIDAGMAATGTEKHELYSAINEVVANYDTAYAEYVTDKMFCMDVKQVNEVYNNSNILGENYYIGEPTAQCVANSEYKDEGYLESDKKWYYWLRSPYSHYSDYVRVVSSDGYVSFNTPYNGPHGVRPAFYLNLSSSIKSGSGTASNPYTIVGGSGGTVSPEANKSVTVMKNNKDMTDGSDEYVICANAKIVAGGKAYSTDGKGKVNLPSVGSAEISCNGYASENIDLANIKNGGKIYLEKSGVNTPILKSVTVNGTDIRREKATIPRNFTGSITAVIDWNGNKEYLTTVENGISVWQMTNGSTGNISLGSEFNSSGDISIVIKTTNGYTVKKKLNLTTTAKNAEGENINISFGDSFRDLGSGMIPYFDGLSFDFDIPNFPCEISVDGNKITGVFGVDVAEWGYENGFKDNKKGEWDIPKKQNAFKELSAIIKDTEKQIKKKGSDKEETVKEYKKLTKKLGNSKKSSQAKFGFDADINAVGYIEGTIDQNGIYLSSGGIIVSAEAKVGVSGEGVLVVVVVPVPYNWEASIKGSIEAQLAIAQREVREQKLSPQGKLSGSLGLKIGGGPGLKKFHANICGNGSLNPEFTFLSAQNGFTLDASVGASLEFVAGRWEKTFELAKKDFHLYPKPKSRVISLYSMSDAYDMSDFELIDRLYLDNPQDFTANDAQIQLFSADMSTKDETTLMTNVYKMAQPQMLALGGDNALLVWMGEDLDASTVNGTSLMYSYYDGMVWSMPKHVSKDGMGDYNPVLKAVGDTVYLVWESAEKVLDDNAGIYDMEEALEIRYAVYNKNTNSFENITRLTNNAYTDYLPQISDVNGSAVITWVSNTENDSFSANNNYALNYVSMSDGEVKTAASGISAVDSHCAVAKDGDIVISYIADTDGDISTNNDNEIFTAAKSGVTRITNDTFAQSAIKEYEGKIYCYNNGELNVSENGSDFTSMGIGLPNDKYIVINDGKTVCYTDGEGAVSDIYSYVYDELQGKWSFAIKLTESDSRISDISGYYDNDGKLQLVFNKTEITGDFEDNISSLFGQSNLSMISITPAYNVAVEYANVDGASILTDRKAKISADIKNKGEKAITSLDVVLTDEAGTELLNETKDITILPGQTEAVELTYTVPDDFESLKGNITVNIPNETDYDTQDNSYQVTLDCVDISLDDVSYVKDESGRWMINAALSNKGLKEENNIEVCLMNGESIVEKKTVASLQSLGTDIVTFENAEEDVEYSVKVTELENETMLGNNDGYVIIQSESGAADYETEVLGCNEVDGKFVINSVARNNTDNAISCVMYSAVYSSDGTLKSCGTVTANIDADSDTGVDITVPCTIETGDTIKTFMWTDEMKPLAQCGKLVVE